MTAQFPVWTELHDSSDYKRYDTIYAGRKYSLLYHSSTRIAHDARTEVYKVSLLRHRPDPVPAHLGPGDGPARLLAEYRDLADAHAGLADARTCLPVLLMEFLL